MIYLSCTYSVLTTLWLIFFDKRCAQEIIWLRPLGFLYSENDSELYLRPCLISDMTLTNKSTFDGVELNGKWSTVVVYKHVFYDPNEHIALCFCLYTPHTRMNYRLLLSSPLFFYFLPFLILKPTNHDSKHNTFSVTYIKLSYLNTLISGQKNRQQ